MMSHSPTNKLPTRAFGVGCFNFRLKREVPFRLSVGQYADELELALSKLNSLSDLEITYDTSAKDEVLNFEEEITPLEDGGEFPFLPFGEVSFTLYIPTRIQDEGVVPSNTETERFRVSILDAFYGPVSYIECLDAGEDCAPSSAVHVVREYLRREFNKLGNVEFEALGPSPFHVDFYVHEDMTKPGVEVVETPVRGYDRFDITVNCPLSSPEALRTVFDAFGHELDLYYYLARKRCIQMHSWQELEYTWSALRSDVSEPFKFYQIPRKFEAHKRARDLISAAYTFTAESSIAKQDATESVQSTFGKGFEHYFKARCEVRLAEAFPDYPVQAIISWATHVHDSSFKLAEIVTVLFSGLLGGFVGALVTALLSAGSATGGSGSAPPQKAALAAPPVPSSPH